VTTVQTLSRLNRVATGKDQTFVLDFVNDPSEILAAFQPYYRMATLAEVSDPNVIHDLRSKLDQARIYEESEVDGAAAAFVREEGNNVLSKWMMPAKQRFAGQLNEALRSGKAGRVEELKLFRSDLTSFVRAYDFLSQLIDYHDTGLEKRSIFYRLLVPLIRADVVNTDLDLDGVALTHYNLRPEEVEDLQLSGEGDSLAPFTAVGSGTARDPEFVRLRQIIDTMNTLFDGDALTEADMVGFSGYLGGKFDENEKLREQANVNTFEQFIASPDLSSAFMDAVIDSDANFSNMSSQVLGSSVVQKAILALLARDFYERHGG
jgi:type I restriction enzyme R subunit